MSPERAGRKAALLRVALVRACGVVSTSVALVALVGWSASLPVLTTLGTDLLPVAPTTAVLLLAGGLALVVDPRLGPGPGLPGRAASAAWGAVALVSLVLLGAAAAGRRIEAEHLGISPPCDPRGTPWGHMVPTTASLFLLLALGFFLPPRGAGDPSAARRLRVARAAAGSVAGAGVVLGIVITYGFLVAASGPVVPPAAGTVIGLVALGAGLFLRAGPPGGAPADSAPAARAGAPGSRGVLAVFALLALGIVVAGFSYFRSTEDRYRADVERQLDFEASLKAEALERWRGDRLADAESLRTNPFFAELVERAFGASPDPASREGVARWIESLRARRSYAWVALLDSRGQVRFTVPPGAESRAHEFATAVLPALEGSLAADGLEVEVGGAFGRLAVVGSLPRSGASARADFVAFGVDPAEHLGPLLASRRASFGIPRTTIVRREGASAVILDGPGAAKSGEVPVLRLPIATSGTVEARGARGESGVLPGVNVHGTNVLAAVRPIPGSKWIVVVWAPLSDVFAASRGRLWGTVLVVLLLVAGAGAGVSAIWRREESRHLHAVIAGEERFRKAFETSPDAVSLTTLDDGTIVAVNQAFQRILGWTEADVVGRSTADIRLWRNPGERAAFVAELRRTGLVENLQVEMATRSGAAIAVLVSASLLEMDGRQHILAVSRDVTERRRIEEALRESETKFRFMAENSGDVIWHLDREYRFDYVSPADERLHGFRPEEVLGKTIWSFLKPEGIERARQVNEKRLADERAGIRTGPVRYELEEICKDGSWVWTEVTVNPYHDGSGQVVGYHGVTRDISERKRMEESLRESERELRQAQVIAGFGSYVLDVAEARWRSSETLDAIFGIDATWDRSVEGWGALIHPEEREEMVRYVTQDVLGRVRPFDREYRIVRPSDGEERWVHGRGEVSTGPDGRATRLSGTIVDVTERRLAEERIRGMNEELERRVAERTEQLSYAVRELESFAYSISHDLKTPLRAIDGYSALLQSDHGAGLGEEARDYLAKVRRGVATMGQLISDLLEYSRLDRRAMRIESVDVDSIVRAVVASRDEEIRSAAAIVRVDGGGVRATADPAGLEMALRNLIDNALKFRRAGRPAEVTIATSRGDGRVRLEVRDNGIGFDMRYRDRIFEIFQRLGRAEDYAGTGVGLALVRRAVQRMGGTVSAESVLGEGSTFRLELPE